MLKDTASDVADYQIALLRNAPLEKHLALLRSLSEFVLQLSRRAIIAAQSEQTESDPISCRYAIIAHNYGQPLADQLRARWQSNLPINKKTEEAMSKPDLLTALTPVVEIFDQLGIAYHIGGSFASSAYGVPRATADIDLIADIKIGQVELFVQTLEREYYINDKSVKDAIMRRSSFNLIHLATMLKIDIFIPTERAYDQEVMRRVQSIKLDSSADARSYYLKSVEDIILTKLEWYQLGGAISERQWHDIIGVLKVQFNKIDFDYLKNWAAALGLTDLLERAVAESRQQS